MSSSILEVHDLIKKYGDFTAVKGVSFDIKEGEIFSLLGPNGAGKTTTISMLSTLYTPTSGDARIGGHSITENPMAVKQVIGVVPQEIALYEDLTARENLVFWGQMYGLSGKSLSSRVEEVLGQIAPERLYSITKNPMAVKQVIGVVPQEIALYEDLTARDNLIFWGQMYGLNG